MCPMSLLLVEWCENAELNSIIYFFVVLTCNILAYVYVYHVLYFNNVYFSCLYYMQYVSFANITKLPLPCVQRGAV